MSERGEILRTKRRLGFAAKGEADAVVVVQANALNAVLPTLLVPLDALSRDARRLPRPCRLRPRGPMTYDHSG